MKSFVSTSCVSFLVLVIAACSGSNDDAINGGIGKVCSGDSACASGLSCREDTDEWISHHQCTTGCQSDNDCTKTFGSKTMCIGANICVSKCDTDSDCPSSTHCSDNGWCANDGPGSGVPKCSGTPFSCTSLGSDECMTALGCSAGGTCEGVAESCFNQTDDYSCNRLSGCYWDSSSKNCSGSTASCSFSTNQYSCTEAYGCSWSASCTGSQIAKTCESQDAALCKYTAGCALVPQ